MSHQENLFEANAEEIGRSGAYSLDSISQTMLTAISQTRQDVLKPISKAEIYKQRFTLEESKSLIISAMNEFDERLGQKTREILETANYNGGEADCKKAAIFAQQPYSDFSHKDNNPFLDKDYELSVNDGQRWNLTPVPAGQSRLMRSLPAKSSQREVVSGYYDPANPHSHSVIEFQFDGTIDGVVHMAHEIGHSIADDYQKREAGHSYNDNPAHIVEMQAYLTQHILWDYLRKHQNPEIAYAAEKHFSATMQMSIEDLPSNSDIGARPVQILTTLGLYHQIRNDDLSTRRKVSETLLGKYGPENINQVLFAAGVKDQNDLGRLAKTAVTASLSNQAEEIFAPRMSRTAEPFQS